MKSIFPHDQDKIIVANKNQNWFVINKQTVDEQHSLADTLLLMAGKRSY